LTLAEFLQKAARGSFAPGEADCALFVADWVRANTGRDPASDLRGTYSDEAGWQAVIASRGLSCVSRIIGRQAQRAGLKMTTDPLEGDIGAVVWQGRVTGAIRGARGRWVMLSESGVIAAIHLRTVAAWSLPCPQQ